MTETIRLHKVSIQLLQSDLKTLAIENINPKQVIYLYIHFRDCNTAVLELRINIMFIIDNCYCPLVWTPIDLVIM